jgi:hypothetical protein
MKMSLDHFYVQYQSQTLENIQHNRYKLLVSLFLKILLIKFFHMSLLYQEMVTLELVVFELVVVQNYLNNFFKQ